MYPEKPNGSLVNWLIIIPTSNGYFIGGIPHFQTYPYDIIDYDHLLGSSWTEGDPGISGGSHPSQWLRIAALVFLSSKTAGAKKRHLLGPKNVTSVLKDIKQNITKYRCLVNPERNQPTIMNMDVQIISDEHRPVCQHLLV